MSKKKKITKEELEELSNAVLSLLADGLNPNILVQQVADIITNQGDWALWVDGRWRINFVCSICGSPYAGICGHEKDPTQRVILRREYKGEVKKELPLISVIPYEEKKGSSK